MGHLGSYRPSPPGAGALMSYASPGGYSAGCGAGESRLSACDRLASSNKNAGTGQAALPPQCMKGQAAWSGAEKRWAKFMKRSGAGTAASRGGDTSAQVSSRPSGDEGEAGGGPIVPTLQIRRKPLHPTLWMKVPRAVSSALLVLRAGPELDSEHKGNLLAGSEVFVLELKPPAADGSVRALISDTPLAGRPPLGWVTSVKDGAELLDYINYQSAMPTIDGATGFFTSVGRPHAAPLPEGSPRSERDGSPRSTARSGAPARVLVSHRGEAGSKLVHMEQAHEQDAPKASGRKGSPSPRLRGRLAHGASSATDMV